MDYEILTKNRKKGQYHLYSIDDIKPNEPKHLIQKKILELIPVLE
jgi:hypothetical protein